jgi:hypothetical protein
MTPVPRASIRRICTCVLFVLLILIASHIGRAASDQPDYAGVFNAIVRDIEAMKGEFPQLREFSANHRFIDRLAIEYQFHTHPPEPRGGWTSGVPNPDDDGVWFYLDFHDPQSKAELYEQPDVNTRACFGRMEVFLLMLEGKKTKPLEARLWAVVKRHIDQAINNGINQNLSPSLSKGDIQEMERVALAFMTAETAEALAQYACSEIKVRLGPKEFKVFIKERFTEMMRIKKIPLAKDEPQACRFNTEYNAVFCGERKDFLVCKKVDGQWRVSSISFLWN